MAFINYITQIHLDFGAVNQLRAECERVGIKRPLIVTDAGVRAAGVLDMALAALGDLPHTVFDQTPSNPTEAAVRAATALARAEGCDGLIAVGGGSSIDLAKGVAIAATHDGPLASYATIEGGSTKITDRVWPLIAVPTTAGTGSEVARGAIVIVDDGRKLGFHSWHLVPRTALCDPELTPGLPAFLTAATGMDAIAHCMETFMAPAVNPPAESIQSERRLQGLAHAMGLPGCDDRGDAIADALQGMNQRLSLPSGLAVLGVGVDQYERIIDGAMADHCHKTDPRLATREDYRAMLAASA